MRVAIVLFCGAVVACAQQDQRPIVSKPTLAVPDTSSTAVADSQQVPQAWAPHLMGSAQGTLAALVPLPPQSSAEIAAADSNTIELQCAPSVISRSDTITLRMEYPHGEYLMVRQPDSTVFFLSYPDPREPRHFFLVPADSFAQMPTIRFRADVRSRPRIYGRDTLEPVFTKPGKYELTIGHKLESDRSSEVHSCTIQLVSL